MKLFLKCEGLEFTSNRIFITLPWRNKFLASAPKVCKYSQHMVLVTKSFNTMSHWQIQGGGTFSPISFNFMPFSAKNLPNNSPLSGKSWICHCNISRKYPLERIKSLQCYELTWMFSYFLLGTGLWRRGLSIVNVSWCRNMYGSFVTFGIRNVRFRLENYYDPSLLRRSNNVQQFAFKRKRAVSCGCNVIGSDGAGPAVHYIMRLRAISRDHALTRLL